MNSTGGPIESASGQARIPSLDALRGLIMVLMALDHARYFIAKDHPAEFWGLLLPEYSNALPFLTRLVTHICAPGFFFLMGTSMVLLAWMRGKSGWSDSRIRKYFISRGALLILVQHLLENPAWLLGTVGLPTAEAMKFQAAVPGGGDTVWLHFGVLYGLGAAMIVCAMLLRMSAKQQVAVGLGAVLTTSALLPGPDNAPLHYPPLMRLFLIPGRSGIWQVFYPLLPWLGLAGFGMAFGQAILRNRHRTLRAAPIIGVVLVLTFVLLRWKTDFGDFHPLEVSGASEEPRWIAFLNVTKYPPSLAFILLTLGVDLLLLGLLSKLINDKSGPHNPLLTFGKTAFFFYLAHLYLYAIVGLFFPRGVSLIWMYPFWLLGLLLLYPLSRWYGNFKQQTSSDSLWRFF